MAEKKQIHSAHFPHPRITLDTGTISKTLQSPTAETDINFIMKKYEKTGLITHLSTHKGKYGNFLPAVDYHEAANSLILANDMFMSLPAGIRTRFDNDPAKFLEFAQDPENVDELIEMGLAKREREPENFDRDAPDPLLPPGEGSDAEPVPEPAAEGS